MGLSHIQNGRQLLQPLPDGILHIDAHADLRPAYQGLRWSHASIMHNVLAEIDAVARIVQVGIRDYCEQELQTILGSEGRVGPFGLGL